MRKPQRALIALLLGAGMAACQSSTGVHPSPSPSASSAPSPSPMPLPHCPAGPPAPVGPQAILTGLAAPDDLAFDAEGRLLFSDIQAGTVSRREPNGTVQTLARGIRNPEGIAVRADGTLLVAEQLLNRVDVVDPQTHTVVSWRVFPNRTGRDGIDGLGRDRISQDVVLPDSPNGVVWRLPGDGSKLTQIGQGMVRPVGADVDVHGNVFVADEGGAIWKIAGSPPSQVRVATLRIPDDVLVDRGGSLVVNTLGDGMVHLVGPDGSVTTLLSGLRNPQGIALDGAGNLFVTEFDAGRIDQLVRAFVLGPPAVTRVDATTVTICPSIRRAASYGLPLALSLADTHHDLQSVIASLPAAGDMSGAIAIHVDPTDRSGTVDLRVSDGDRMLVQHIVLPPVP
jgi:sugar lactone lactonase YvrE